MLFPIRLSLFACWLLFQWIAPHAPFVWEALPPAMTIDTSIGNPYAKTMEVHLTADQKAFSREAIETGRLHREEDALQEAMSLWEERQRRR